MRSLPGLQDGYFNLDERTFSDLLAMATEFARVVKFYDTDMRAKSDWTFYFSADETIVISRILSSNLHEAAEQFDAWWERTNDLTVSTGQKKWKAQGFPVIQLIHMINTWLVALESASTESGQRLHMLITAVIGQLRVDSLTARLTSAMSAGNAAGLRLHPLWAVEGDRHVEQKTVITKALVRSNFYAFIKAIEMIKKEALLCLPESLKTQYHDPAIGLLIAFIQLYQRLQTKLNRYTQNYLDFYYDQILRIVPLAPVSDRSYLVFESNVPGHGLRIPAQTEFLAGLDAAKRDIIYVSDKDLIVNDAKVQALETVFLEHNCYSSPENLLTEDDVLLNEQPPQKIKSRSWPSNAWLNSISLLAIKEHENGGKMRAQPLFGAQKNATEGTLFADARIGFALSSQVLLLKEGWRNISVTLHFDNAVLQQRITQLAQVMGQDTIYASVELEDIHRQDVFLKVFRNMFRITLSSERGWLDVPHYIPSHEVTGSDSYILKIEFELAPEAPPVVPYDAALHGENYATSAPVVRFIINSGAYLYPYGMLRELPLSGATIEVKVQGCRDLVLHNNIGQLSATAPFAPFGPLPKIGSYLIVGSTEMARKQLSSFAVDIEWADFPLVVGGFNSYYSGYDIDVNNADFLATASVLSNGTWVTVDAKTQPAMPLFATLLKSGMGGRIASHIRLLCNGIARQFHPDNGLPLNKALEYSSSAKNSFFKFTLAAPGFAFGHDIYPHILASRLIANARLKRVRRQRAIPNPPYTPLINAISIRYSASADIRFERKPAGASGAQDVFLHLYPSGWEILGPASYPAPALLPRYDYAGNLYIGLNAVDLKGVITLFFHLREDSWPLSVQGSTAIDWFYLSENTWKPIYKNNIVSDTTHSFMTSGIVTLHLPSDISDDNTVMPADLYWLRLSADSELEKYCSVYAVYAQAVQVSRQHHAQEDVPTILPAGTIKRSRKTIPGIVKITQVIDSFGGRGPETRAQLRMRVSERLRHKNRAISAVDYELLILQHFPAVYKVKCFANIATDRGPADCIRPGHVLVVPLPYWPSVGQHMQPVLSGDLVQEINGFLLQLASPWSAIAVENPVYEHIQVRCQVKLKDGLSGGDYINQLNQDISDFLTPWNDRCGYQTHFGWRIRQHDVEAYIVALDYIDSVSRFSMLRISSVDTHTFSLFDTAAGDAGNDHADISAQYPWSVAIPVARHVIEVVAYVDARAPLRTALGRLEIGSTFIVSEGGNNV